MSSWVLISICQKKGLRHHRIQALMGKETSTKFHWKHTVQEITLGKLFWTVIGNGEKSFKGSWFFENTIFFLNPKDISLSLNQAKWLCQHVMEIKTRNEETMTPQYSNLFLQWEHDLIYQNGFWFSPQGSKYQACDSEKAYSPGDTRSLSTQAVTGHAQHLRQAGPWLATFPLLSPFPRLTHQLGLPSQEAGPESVPQPATFPPTRSGAHTSVLISMRLWNHHWAVSHSYAPAQSLSEPWYHLTYACFTRTT